MPPAARCARARACAPACARPHRSHAALVHRPSPSPHPALVGCATRAQNHPLPPAWIDGATHNNLETVHSVAYMRAFRAFLKHLLSTAPNAPPPKPGGWFDWLPGAGKPSTPTTTVDPGMADAANASASAEKPTSTPLPNPWAKSAAAASS